MPKKRKIHQWGRGGITCVLIGMAPTSGYPAIAQVLLGTRRTGESSNGKSPAIAHMAKVDIIMVVQIV